MSKDAYWFKHDSNAKDDPKCMLLIEEMGVEGYGIFWILVEMLRDQPDYRASIRIIPAVARRYNTTTEKVKAVVIRYDLFQVIDGEFFFSESLISRMSTLDKMREGGRLGGKKSGEIRQIKAKTKGASRGLQRGLEPLDKIREDKIRTEENRIEEKREEQEEKNSRVSDVQFNHPKSVEKAVEIGEMRGIPKAHAEIYFEMRNAQGWCRTDKHGNITPIANWQSDMVLCWRKGYLEPKKTTDNDLPF